jgi:hypothetical protein
MERRNYKAVILKVLLLVFALSLAVGGYISFKDSGWTRSDARDRQQILRLRVIL